MPAQADRDYHVERARAELDAAYRAVGSDAAQAHLRLCSMHMARAKALLESEARVRRRRSWDGSRAAGRSMKNASPPPIERAVQSLTA